MQIAYIVSYATLSRVSDPLPAKRAVSVRPYNNSNATPRRLACFSRSTTYGIRIQQGAQRTSYSTGVFGRSDDTQR